MMAIWYLYQRVHTAPLAECIVVRVKTFHDNPTVSHLGENIRD